jgi:hypothetical protein
MSNGDVPFGDSGPVAYNPDVPVAASRSNVEAQIMAMPGVNGVGEGRDKLGNPAWIAYVDSNAVAAALPKMIAGRAVIVEVTGGIDAQPR